MAWLASLAPNEIGTGGREIYLRECASCHRDDLKGAPPEIPSLAGVAGRRQLGAITPETPETCNRLQAEDGATARWRAATSALRLHHRSVEPDDVVPAQDALGPVK